MAQRVMVSGYLVTPEPIGLTPDVLGIRLGDLEDLTLQLVEDGPAPAMEDPVATARDWVSCQCGMAVGHVPGCPLGERLARIELRKAAE